MAERLTAVCEGCKKVIYQGRMSLTDPHISHGSCEACSIKMLWDGGLDERDLTEFANRHMEASIEA